MSRRVWKGACTGGRGGCYCEELASLHDVRFVVWGYNLSMDLTVRQLTLRQQARAALDQLRAELLAHRTVGGYWTGELSSSALSTATAVSALSASLLYASDTVNAASESEGKRRESLIRRGMSTLRNSQNEDGGYGDTDRSHSNIATSYLALAASTLAGKVVGQDVAFSAAQQSRLESYLDSCGRIEGLRNRYGTDKTFVVPILTNMAIAGLVPWSEVAALPFEAAVFPQSMYRLLRMPVVSYAIPALVAIGQARHFLGPRALPPLRWIRAASVKRTMKVLQRMQPESGGYLEATPLTSFVVMSLAVTGRGDCEVARRGLDFLEASITEDDSWPIDTNLATWVTSLSMHALASDPDDNGDWCREELVRWHLGCQHRRRHPFTGAEPGGWGWTNLSGAVPDSDDTPAAIIALADARKFVSKGLQKEIDLATADGIQWLAKLQNRDGGWPTFCRGWGTLPFDRSSTDLTAHALRAFHAANTSGASRLVKSTRFLERSQRPDGSWLPLWFGNQDLPNENNPTYGTARVLLAFGSVNTFIKSVSVGLSPAACDRGVAYLLDSQNHDGGWGGGPSVAKWIVGQGLPCRQDLVSSVEETSLALEALAQLGIDEQELLGGKGVKNSLSSDKITEKMGGGNDPHLPAIIRGVEFLLQSVRDGHHRVSWPIGFYFAKLWYHERLYPLIFATAALGAYLKATASDDEE